VPVWQGIGFATCAINLYSGIKCEELRARMACAMAFAVNRDRSRETDDWP